jgi:hypothetical protein
MELIYLIMDMLFFKGIINSSNKTITQNPTSTVGTFKNRVFGWAFTDSFFF